MEPERAYCHHCQVQPEPGKDLQGQSPWPALEGRVTGVCVQGDVPTSFAWHVLGWAF